MTCRLAARSILLCTVVTLCASLVCRPAQAAQTAAQTAFEFAPEPMIVDSFGLKMSLIDGSVTITSTAERLTRVQLPDDLGVMVVHNQQYPGLDTEEVLDRIVSSIRSEHAVRSGGRVTGTRATIDRPSRTLDVDSRFTSPVYATIKPETGRRAAAYRGYIAVQTFGPRFIIFELITSAPNAERARGMFEAMALTAEFTDPIEVETKRRAAVQSGLGLLNGLTRSEIEALIRDHGERWYRLYAEGSGGRDGERELGYRRVRAQIGKRSDFEGLNQPGGGGGDANQEGLIVRIDSRLLNDEAIIDSRSVFFSSLDMQEEAWTIELTVRTQAEPMRFREFGFRSGNNIRVVVRDADRNSRDIVPRILGEGYISQTLGYLLPQLLISRGAPLEYGFYLYQPSTNNIQLRMDELTRGSGGGWVVTTSYPESGTESSAAYTDDGELIASENANGSRWEPSSLQELIDLWRSKGLPLD